MRGFWNWAGNEVDNATGIGFAILVTGILLAILAMALFLLLLSSEQVAAALLIFPGLPFYVIWRAYRGRNQ